MFSRWTRHPASPYREVSETGGCNRHHAAPPRQTDSPARGASHAVPPAHHWGKAQVQITNAVRGAAVNHTLALLVVP